MSPDAIVSSNPALTLADFTRPGLILPRLHGRNASVVIEELSQALHRNHCLPDMPGFCRAVLERESLASSDMETGMAFPHARVPGLAALSFALGCSEAPVKWSGTASQPVHLVFLLAVPENDSTQYLSLISGLVRLAKDRELTDRLRTAPDAECIFAALQQISLRINPAPTR